MFRNIYSSIMYISLLYLLYYCFFVDSNLKNTYNLRNISIYYIFYIISNIIYFSKFNCEGQLQPNSNNPKIWAFLSLRNQTARHLHGQTLAIDRHLP